ncbi:MAG: ethanolamine utilization protein EutN, partial [Chloroflexi bacterium]|nr:ethanolamine utilization protein EutN [Chloroflexota bacterium]
MILGRVVGAIHSTINHPFYDARTLLIVEKTRPDGEPAGGYLVAVDTVDAGIG